MELKSEIILFIKNTNRASINQSLTKNTSDNTQGKNEINDSENNNSINAIKEQVATIKENSTSVQSNNQRKIKELNHQS